MSRVVDERRLPAIDAWLGERAAAGAWPGAAYAIGAGADSPRWIGAVGSAALVPQRLPAELDTLYDLASLTKVIATTAIALRMADAGLVDLDQPLAASLPEMRDFPGGTPSLVDLLSHRAGLPAWLPLYRIPGGLSDPVGTCARSATGRRGVALYSDLSALCAGCALERLSGVGLRDLFARLVAEPLSLGTAEIGFSPLQVPVVRIAPTEIGRAREAQMIGAPPPLSEVAPEDEPLRGQPHDGNAAALGGAAGHAGLFGTVGAVYAVARQYLFAGALFSQPALRRVGTEYAANETDRRGFGFQLGAAPAAPAGRFGSASLGHTGFTGTSIWLDPEREWVAVLLTNRVHPRWTDAPMQNWRRQFHDLAAGALNRGVGSA